MLREEVWREWQILKDNLVSEKVVKEEVNKLQQQEFAQKTNRIIVLEGELEAERDNKEMLVENLVGIVNNLVLNKETIKSEIEEARKKFVLRENESVSPQSATVEGWLNALFVLLKKLAKIRGSGGDGPTIEEVD